MVFGGGTFGAQRQWALLLSAFQQSVAKHPGAIRAPISTESACLSSVVYRGPAWLWSDDEAFKRADRAVRKQMVDRWRRPQISTATCHVEWRPAVEVKPDAAETSLDKARDAPAINQTLATFLIDPLNKCAVR